MDETVKNKLKDARIAKIKNESKVEQLQWMHTIGLCSAESEYYTLTEGRMLRIGFAKLVCRLESEITTLTALRFFECEGNRHRQTMMLWLQERVAAKHLRVVKVASESNPADMLTKALGRSKVEEFCADIGQTEPRAETLDKESKGVKKPKEVKFAVEAIVMDEAVKNRFKDAIISRAKNKLKDAKIAKIKNESMVEKLQWMHTMD